MYIVYVNLMKIVKKDIEIYKYIVYNNSRSQIDEYRFNNTTNICIIRGLLTLY